MRTYSHASEHLLRGSLTRLQVSKCVRSCLHLHTRTQTAATYTSKKKKKNQDRKLPPNSANKKKMKEGKNGSHLSFRCLLILFPSALTVKNNHVNMQIYCRANSLLWFLSPSASCLRPAPSSGSGFIWRIHQVKSPGKVIGKGRQNIIVLVTRQIISILHSYPLDLRCLSRKETHHLSGWQNAACTDICFNEDYWQNCKF